MCRANLLGILPPPPPYLPSSPPLIPPSPLQTKFLVSNFHRWSLNNLVLDNNCLTNHFIIKIFHLLTDKPPPCVSHKNSSETMYGYCLPKFESVCCWKLKIFLFFFGWKFMLKYMIRLNIKHLSKLIYKGKSRLKEL